jgi:soluble lytic murein transglycosylase-like protein
VACAVSPASDIQAAIASAAARHGLDPAVLTALAHVESGFRADAVSPDGALGIAQLMPQTAREMGVADPFDLRAGLEGGARYLKEQLGRFSGNLALALAAYNAGPAAVARYGGIPPYPETQRFVSRVLDLAKRYAGR